MRNYKDLKIYQLAFDLAIRVHRFSTHLPKFEQYEQASQIRRSSKSIKDNIVEGYGRRRYKADFIKFLTYAHASCDETINHLETIKILYPDLNSSELLSLYDSLGRQLNKYIQYVEKHWNKNIAHEDTIPYGISFKDEPIADNIQLQLHTPYPVICTPKPDYPC